MNTSLKTLMITLLITGSGSFIHANDLLSNNSSSSQKIDPSDFQLADGFTGHGSYSPDTKIATITAPSGKVTTYDVTSEVKNAGIRPPDGTYLGKYTNQNYQPSNCCGGPTEFVSLYGTPA